MFDVRLYSVFQPSAFRLQPFLKRCGKVQKSAEKCFARANGSRAAARSGEGQELRRLMVAAAGWQRAASCFAAVTKPFPFC